MSIKTKIKNDLWRINYILPFVKKYQFSEKGKIDMMRHILKAYADIKLIKSKENTVGFDTKMILAKANIVIDSSSQFIYFIDTKKTITAPGNILSNFTIDYDKIIHGTFNDIAKSALGADEYGKEAKAVIDGIRYFNKKIQKAIFSSTLPAAIKERRLSNFQNMFSKTAEHFDEGLQRILFFNQVIWQTRHRLNGLGRLDKILSDLYQHDLETGVLTYELASEMVLDFMTQLSKYPNYKSDALEGDIGQIIILGGLERNGVYFYNDLTEIFLKQQAKLGRPDPKTVLRVSNNMPENLLKISIECLISKTGSPLFSNDEVVIPALLEFGISEEDAYSYCTSACWEPFIVGKSLDQNNIAVFDFFSALDKMMGQNIESFEELLVLYKKMNANMFKKFLQKIDQMKWAKDPLVSMFTTSCNEKRKDISEGAATYNNYGITTVAISNVVDSLLNIKKLVFEQKKYTLPELDRLRKKNFEGAEKLYKELQSTKKFYGHDESEIIALVNDITNNIADVAKEYKNQYGGSVKFGLSSPGYNILSKKVNADVSGRKFGAPYNTHISCLDTSYTEVVNFASQLDYRRQRFNGNVIDYFVAPHFLNDNSDKFMIFMKAAITTGFFQMQMNIMDSNTLLDAKVHPENYKGLIVRVWGFSAYFNELPESYKDLLIDRAIAAERIA